MNASSSISAERVPAGKSPEPSPSRFKHNLLTGLIVAGLVLGVVVGQLMYVWMDEAPRLATAEFMKFLGGITFMNWLKMVLVPLVVSSVVVGVAGVGSPGQLGRVGGFTLAYYFCTMAAAVVLGILLVSTIQPGAGFPEEFRDAAVENFTAADGETRGRVEGASGTGLAGAARNILSQVVPTNPIGAAASGEMLPLIVASLLLGVVLTVLGEKARPLLAVFEALFAAMMKLVDWILWLAPIGVFFLVAYTVATIGFAQLVGPLSKYILTVVAGLAVHGLIVLPVVLYLLGRTNPFRYMHQMREALMTAFGTDSSSATLPVTMEMAETQGGVSKRAAGFVLPLGATINMDGTALYEAVAVVFLFQAFGIDLSIAELVIITITATLAAVGAAGIPSAGLVTMVIVIEAVNGSLGNMAPHLPLAAVGIILGVDRILDMCRTTVNVWGDAVGAKLITRLAPDEPEDAAVTAEAPEHAAV